MIETSCRKCQIMNFIIILAAQMAMLGQLIPVMIGHKVPSEDQHWANYLLLLRISPVTSEEDCQYMKVNIHNHEMTYK